MCVDRHLIMFPLSNESIESNVAYPPGQLSFSDSSGGYSYMEYHGTSLFKIIYLEYIVFPSKANYAIVKIKVVHGNDQFQNIRRR